MNMTELPQREAALAELAQFEQRYGYDAEYVRIMLESDPAAFVLYKHLTDMSGYIVDIPLEARFASGLATLLHEDCGPCAQLCVKMAQEAGVSSETIRAVLAGKPELMTENARLAYRFTQATLAHDPNADDLRQEILERWGMRALLSLCFGMIAARSYPLLRYGMGYGQSCTRVMVDGDVVQPVH
ncbi:MAG TPA: hypothetical protein V6C99_09800 [Oculatellaceae cyanobacterium]|jgi:hypothetical protein